uniref:Putative Na+ channel toxin n=1 Tax=Superstitionia donensis TaxID=311983 RepID=A0A1V1WC92_9SCOR
MMKTAVLSIVGILLLLNLDIVVLQMYDGYIYDDDGTHYPCRRIIGHKYCEELCKDVGAGEGWCKAFPSGCFCRGLDIRKHGGYPRDKNGDWIWCGLPGGKNKECENVCTEQGAGYGYCYDRYCWCEAP